MGAIISFVDFCKAHEAKNDTIILLKLYAKYLQLSIQVSTTPWQIHQFSDSLNKERKTKMPMLIKWLKDNKDTLCCWNVEVWTLGNLHSELKWVSVIAYFQRRISEPTHKPTQWHIMVFYLIFLCPTMQILIKQKANFHHQC